MALFRHAEIWFPSYCREGIRRRLESGPPAERVWLAITDHFEPLWRCPDDDVAQARVEVWHRAWPTIARRNTDSTGRCAQYTFFFPEEEYRPEFLDPLAEMTRQGVADVEVHLHHDNDTEAGFIEKVEHFKQQLHERHGLLRKADGRLVFGFIHGNWALDNSRPDGRACGLNNEITLLRELGCYADFTMPSGDDPTQVRQVNSIYWAIDDPEKPRSHEHGPVVQAGSWEPRDLLMITGPIGLRWGEGRWMARIEAAEVAARDPATKHRVRRWLELAPRIGTDVFLKLHTHGAQAANLTGLLGGGLDSTFQLLSAECGRRGLKLHYVTAWEMRQVVERAARYGTAEPATSEGLHTRTDARSG